MIAIASRSLTDAMRIEELAFHVQRHVRRRETIDAHDRRAPDGVQNAVVDHVGFSS